MSIVILMCYNLLVGIGYFKEGVDYSFFRGLNPAVYLILFLCIFGKYKFFDNKINNYFLLVISILSSFNLLSGRNVDMKMMMTGFVSPILIYQFFNSYKYDSYILRAKKILITFYIIECGLAIFERIIGTNMFVKVNAGYDGFRSYSLIGHPLQNALCVSIMMSFILFSDLKYKLELFFL